MARQGFIPVLDDDTVKPDTKPLPTRVEFYDAVPEHIRIIMQAGRDIQFLIQGHLNLILPTLEVTTTPEGQKAVPDVDSVFIHAAIVMLVSAWEACIEELTSTGFEFLLAHCNSPDKLPIELKRQIAKEIKGDKHELSPWKLAGDGWKSILTAYKDDVLSRTARNFNTPKPARIDELTEALLSVKVTNSWRWSNYDPQSILKVATQLVEIRGAIAHGKKPPDPLGFQELAFFSITIQQLAALTNNAVNAHLEKITGKSPWVWIRFNSPLLRCDQTDKVSNTDGGRIVDVPLTGLIPDELQYSVISPKASNGPQTTLVESTATSDFAIPSN